MNAVPTLSAAELGLSLPQHASLPTRLKIATRALLILVKEPDHGIAAPVLTACLDSDVFAAMCDELKTTDAGRELLAQRPSLEARHVDLEALARLPENTVGHAFARYFADNHIQPFKSPYAAHTDAEYLVKWYRETHDLHHVLTGYGTDAQGEMELQAFVAGNLGLRTSLFILTSAALFRPHGLPPMWRYAKKLRSAYRRGQASEKLIRIRYDLLLEAPLEVARQQIFREAATAPRPPIH